MIKPVGKVALGKPNVASITDGKIIEEILRWHVTPPKEGVATWL